MKQDIHGATTYDLYRSGVRLRWMICGGHGNLVVNSKVSPYNFFRTFLLESLFADPDPLFPNWRDNKEVFHGHDH